MCINGTVSTSTSNALTQCSMAVRVGSSVSMPRSQWQHVNVNANLVDQCEFSFLLNDARAHTLTLGYLCWSTRALLNANV